MPAFTLGATAQWIDPGGTAWDLTDPDTGWFTVDEVTGLGAAPVKLTTDSYPRGGARVRWDQPQPRVITWGLHIFGADHLAFLANWRRLAYAFSRTRRDGPGTLVIARQDGTARQIAAYYQDGFDNTPGGHFIDDDVVLTLFCEDPFWRDVDPVVEGRQYLLPASYLSPYPQVSTGQGLGASTIINPGDVEAWPQWSITGPATSILAANAATGETFTLDPNAAGIAHGPLLAGEQVIVTTESPAITGPDGSPWTGAIDWSTSALWGLAPGVNPVTITLNDAAVGSSAQLTFTPRYETP